MTKSEIVKAANKVVRDYMDEGWMISAGDSCSGYFFKVDMEKDGNKIRVGINSFYGRDIETNVLLDSLVMAVEELDLFGFVAINDGTKEIARYYEVTHNRRFSDNGWWVEDKKEAVDSLAKRYKRYENIRELNDRELVAPLTIDFIKRLKGITGFSSASRNNISVTRTKRGYNIFREDRNGFAKAVYTISFPAKKEAVC